MSRVGVPTRDPSVDDRASKRPGNVDWYERFHLSESARLSTTESGDEWATVALRGGTRRHDGDQRGSPWLPPPRRGGVFEGVLSSGSPPRPPVPFLEGVVAPTRV